jgi:peptide deformylase
MAENPLQPEQLRIILWPDPRLRKSSAPVKDFTPWLKRVAARMFELMREARGVGLAAPQVGLNLRMFVINPTGEAPADTVYVNPILSEAEDEEDGEEGCLSLPGINIDVMRSKKLRIQAQDLDGNSFEQVESGYIARIWQHENDHLNGTLLLDRMGPVAKMTQRKKIKELEARWVEVHGKLPKK